MKIIAFIFARGGSKGIKNKNLLKFKRTTLLGHAINQARQIKDVKKVFLSTDDKVLAKYGKKHKAEVPFLRPKNLAKDNSPEIDSWRHAIKYLKDKLKLKPDYIISVPTTCPLRKISDLNLGIKLAKRKKLDILFSVTKASRSPYFNIIIKKGNKINLVSKFLKKQNKKTISRRQDGPKCFDLTTACYVFKPDYVMRTKDLFSGKVDLIEIPKERGIDIDNIYDYRLIKLLNKNV